MTTPVYDTGVNVLEPGRIPQPGIAYVPDPTTTLDSPNGSPLTTTTSSSSGGGGGGSSAPTLPSIDWASFFWGALGLPPDLISQINTALASVTDASMALAIGTNILRSSQWYAQTYPGINYGIRNGLFADEQGYRDYVNKINQLYQQYYGRNVTTSEVTGYLQNGNDYSYIGNLLQGAAIATAEKPQLQYETGAFDQAGPLSQQELTAYGQEKAGIDTTLGQMVTNRVNLAVQRMQKAFSQRIDIPTTTLGPQGLYIPALQGNKNTNSTRSGSPDVAAL